MKPRPMARQGWRETRAATMTVCETSPLGTTGESSAVPDGNISGFARRSGLLSARAGLAPASPSPRCCRSRLCRGSSGLICQRTVVLSVLETPCGFLPAVACFPAASACAAACGLPCSVRFAVCDGFGYLLASARAVRLSRRW